MRRWFRSIGMQLFVWIFGAMAVVFLLVAYLNDRRTSEAWQGSFEEQSNRMAGVIDRALRFGMLLENKDAVHRTLEALAKEPGILGVRIYDKKGKVKFSTHSDEIGQRFDKKSEACVGCHHHPDEKPTLDQWSRTYRNQSQELVLGHVHLIKNESRCASADCHVSPEDKPLLGALEVQTSLAPLDQAHRDAQKSTVYATILMALAGGTSAGLFIWRFVRHPMKQLIEGTRRVAQGDMSGDIEIREQNGELKELATAFNRMTGQLREAKHRTDAWERELQQAVAQKTAELSRVHQRMTHMEKMASLGKLSATVAHELNNPLAGIMVYAKLVKRELDAGDEESRRYLDVIVQESARCGDIVRNLLTFARESSAQFAPHDLNEIVERTLMTVQHLLRDRSIEVGLRPLAGDARIVADGNQIQQALVALLINAIEAMPQGGELGLTVEADAESVRIAVSDTGMGIDPEVLPNIFEPFVSTKHDKGVGLGLSVVYGIAQRHSGNIEVQSTLGHGTIMTLTLPRNPSSSRPNVEPRDAA